MNEDYNETMLRNCLEKAEEMKSRILSGEVIADEIYQVDGSRILVTRTSSNKYGYAVFERDEEEPCYLVESDYLISDLQKRTDYYGHALAYSGAKSMVEKNMIGIFYEYKKYPDFHEFYVSIKVPNNCPIEIKQMMAGYNPQYPVTLLGADFITREFHYAALADIFLDPKSGVPIVQLGAGFVRPDGTPDYDRALRMEIEAQENRPLYGLPPIETREAQEIVGTQTILAQSFLTPLYEAVGLPMLEGIEYCPLLEEALAGRDISKYLTSDGKLLPKDGAGALSRR